MKKELASERDGPERWGQQTWVFMRKQGMAYVIGGSWLFGGKRRGQLEGL